MSVVARSIPQSLRNLVGKCSRRIVSAPGVSWLHAKTTGRRHLIFTFHRLRENGQLLDPFDTCPSHSLAEFGKWVDSLAGKFEIVPLSELPDRRNGQEPLAAITFDDGWRDTFDLAFPFLQKKGLPATMFVTTGKIGRSVPFWQQILGNLFRAATKRDGAQLAGKLREIFRISGTGPISRKDYCRTVAHLKKSRLDADAVIVGNFASYVSQDSGQRCFVNEHEIETMARSCFTIGSHTSTHSLLDQLPEDRIRSELSDSKLRLESLVRRSVDLLAYPNGNVDDRVRAIASELGYSLGCTTVARKCSPADDRMLLPRIEPPWDVDESFSSR